MTEILQRFVCKISDDEYVNCIISVIEFLVEIGNTDSYFNCENVTVAEISKNKHMTRYCQLIKKFQEMLQLQGAVETVLY